MKTSRLSTQVLIGVLIAVILMPGIAQAQFGGPVTVIADTSPTTIATQLNTAKSLAESIQQNAKQAAVWLEEKERYIREIEEQVKRYTKLAGILDTATEMIQHKDSVIAAMTEIANTVRAVMQLKSQIEYMVVRRVATLRQIYGRLRSGVFDANANLRDLEAYLKSTLGGGWDSRVEVWQIGVDRLAMQDTQLANWYDEWQQLNRKIVNEKQQLDEVDKQLQQENSKPIKNRSEMNIQTLTMQQEEIHSRIRPLEDRAAELLDLIKTRFAYYNVQLRDMWGFGEMVRQEQANWGEFLNINQQALEALDDYTARPRTIQHAGQPITPDTVPLPRAGQQ